MTSKLSVDTIQGVSQAGNITIQGEGTAETNLQQGLAKAWLQGTTSAGLSDLQRVTMLTLTQIHLQIMIIVLQDL